MRKLILRSIAIGLLCFLITIFTTAQSSKRICVIGSSSAYGYFPNTTIPRDSSWAYKIKDYYKSIGLIDTLFNIATPGIDCYSGMPTSYVQPPGRNAPDPLHNITRALNLVPKPDYIIVNFPTNSYDYLDISEVMFCLKTIKDSAEAKNIKCYITTTQPRDNFSPSERQKLKEIRNQIMATFGFWAIDFFTDISVEPGLNINPLYALGDGVHLNPSGHSVLANKVYDKNIFFNVVSVDFSKIFTKYQDGKVFISWQTLSEKNNNGFVVEKSNDGIHFKAMETIYATGISTTPKNYNSIDLHSVIGKNYYRIKTIGVDNFIQYSEIAIINCDKDALLKSKFYPTVATNKISIVINAIEQAGVSVSIIDMSGKIVLQSIQQMKNANPSTIGISKLAAGNYTCMLQYNGVKESHQFIKAE